jgi:3-oxoacyl-[acyl-carrier-protein] synthase II
MIKSYLPQANNNNTISRRVVITGYGALCSLGNNVDEIWKAICDYKVGYQREEFSDPNIVSKFFGFMHNKPSHKFFPKTIFKFLPEFAKLGMHAVQEAIVMAFGGREQLIESCSPLERGVIFGTGWGAQDESVKEQRNYFKEGNASPFSNILVMSGVATAAISMHWNLRGYQNTPIAACSTGGIAIGDAFEAIRAGRAKVMIAGGGESIRSEAFCIWSIDALRALSKEQNDVEKACCPFSLDRSGFILSEGAAVLCLEEMEFAQARGAQILGEVLGYGNFTDAWDITSPAPDMLARTSAIKSACNQAQIKLAEIDYINAHGTSTPLNDENETKALKLAFGDIINEIPISSTKSYTGHLVGAAGSLESIFCLKTIETKLMPATIHLKRLDPRCDLDFIPNTHRTKDEIRYVLNVNYGFGGSNSALVFGAKPQ